MNNKKLATIIGIAIIILVAGGALVFSLQRSAATVEKVAPQEQAIGTLTPGDLGLQLKLSDNNHKVKVLVQKVSDIKALEYDITYDADIPASELAPGEQGVKVERGFNDEAKISVNQTKYESKDFDLGSCSRNVCRYDTGVDSVNIVMKVTKRTGKIYQVKDSIKIQ
jgi:hypothetical protein